MPELGWNARIFETKKKDGYRRKKKKGMSVLAA